MDKVSEDRISELIDQKMESLVIVFRFELMKAVDKIKDSGPAIAETADSSFLKAASVCQLLDISQSTLKRMRADYTIDFTKIKGVTYYSKEEILRLMHDNKISALRDQFQIKRRGKKPLLSSL